MRRNFLKQNLDLQIKQVNGKMMEEFNCPCGAGKAVAGTNPYHYFCWECREWTYYGDPNEQEYTEEEQQMFDSDANAIENMERDMKRDNNLLRQERNNYKKLLHKVLSDGLQHHRSEVENAIHYWNANTVYQESMKHSGNTGLSQDEEY